MDSITDKRGDPFISQLHISSLILLPEIKSNASSSSFYSYLSIRDRSDEISPLMAVLHFVVDRLAVNFEGGTQYNIDGCNVFIFTARAFGDSKMLKT